MLGYKICGEFIKKQAKNGTGKADGNQGGGAGGPREGGKVGSGGEVEGGKRGRVRGGKNSPPKSSALSDPGVVIGLSYMKEELLSQLEEIAKKG